LEDTQDYTPEVILEVTLEFTLRRKHCSYVLQGYPPEATSIGVSFTMFSRVFSRVSTRSILQSVPSRVSSKGFLQDVLQRFPQGCPPRVSYRVSSRGIL
jgi:hypothetical protein